MKHSKSGLFLMEMIVCILFFSLSAAVCAQMFAKSHSISENNINENHAVIISANIAECFYAEYGNNEKINALYYDEKGVISEDSLALYFDSQYDLCSKDSAPLYKAVLTVTPSNANEGMLDGIVKFYVEENKSGSINESLIYTLNLQVNNPNHI